MFRQVIWIIPFLLSSCQRIDWEDEYGSSSTDTSITTTEVVYRDSIINDSLTIRIPLVTNWYTTLPLSIPEGYYLPTKEQAKWLKNLSFSTSQRIICLQDSVYYTFGYQSKSITQAGSKTAYTLLFIKSQPKVDTNIQVDTQWAQTDSIKL